MADKSTEFTVFRLLGVIAVAGLALGCASSRATRDASFHTFDALNLDDAAGVVEPTEAVGPVAADVTEGSDVEPVVEPVDVEPGVESLPPTDGLDVVADGACEIEGPMLPDDVSVADAVAPVPEVVFSTPVVGLPVIEEPEPVDVEPLIKALGKSRKANRQARAELVALGSVAAPELVLEMERTLGRRLSEDRMEHLVRLVRVLREIGTADGIDACSELILRDSLPGSGEARHALLSESLVYISEHFDSEKGARDAYYAFVTRYRSRYMERKVHKMHWGRMGYVERLSVDVLTGLAHFVKSKDYRSREVLKALLGVLVMGSPRGVSVYCLADNGYDVKYSSLNSLSLSGDRSLAAAL